MRVYIGSITHETNAFSPLPTGFQDYHYHEVGYEDLVNSAQAAGFDVVKGTCARAAPSAPTARADYEQLRDRIAAGSIETQKLLVPEHLYAATVAMLKDDDSIEVHVAPTKLF